ncbi:flagellar biosynthesis protein FlgA [Syntrophotalea acetylenivorans]|uniref:Flagellar P-ring protein n=1 Tax=Syntrophotalea acetylenivorans TaxID=1842532 RepID=A0A1L3GSX8_9BACT|nr:flagellar basal body P-ring protein FlgI [Syntrophotalea acetylenivorans]APG29031.1 flagellar biosynthesis protein FlgA [Syntrophotalea acetylenivorans]
MKEFQKHIFADFLTGWPFTLLLILLLLPSVATAARIKDIAQIEGVRSNQLVGYGLVIGLNGTGDSDSTQFTVQSLVNMMERLGVTVSRDDVKVDNVAAVIVTAELPPFAKAGTTIDVTVSSIGDADSLAGGSLLMTPLKAPDGNIYAVAQGPLIVGSLAFGGKAAKVQKNHPTVGRLPGGALVEREIPFTLNPDSQLRYQLAEADFTTVSRIAAVINNHFKSPLATPVDSASLNVAIPLPYRERLVDFVATLEGLPVQPDATAKIVVNEKTGTIVMGEGVRIATVAVSHGNLNLVISESAEVSQPFPFSQGETVAIPQTDIAASEDEGNLVVLQMGVSIGDVAQALNAIGATPRDLIAIFQAIKASGALHAELVVL